MIQKPKQKLVKKKTTGETIAGLRVEWKISGAREMEGETKEIEGERLADSKRSTEIPSQHWR